VIVHDLDVCGTATVEKEEGRRSCTVNADLKVFYSWRKLRKTAAA
jgi:hypothetical protein